MVGQRFRQHHINIGDLKPQFRQQKLQRATPAAGIQDSIPARPSFHLRVDPRDIGGVVPADLGAARGLQETFDKTEVLGLQYFIWINILKS
jgi:hypothetical protein